MIEPSRQSTVREHGPVTGFAPAAEAADAERLQDELLPLILEASQPYARSCYGDDRTARAILAATMRQPSSEVSLERTTLLLEAGELRGFYIALPGDALGACRRQELGQALRQMRGDGMAALQRRLAALGAPFAPVAADAFYLSKIGLCPDARGQGLGRRLLDHYIETGRQRGFRRFRLDVGAGNLPARRLYERAGFQVMERQDGNASSYLAMTLTT